MGICENMLMQTVKDNLIKFFDECCFIRKEVTVPLI